MDTINDGVIDLEEMRAFLMTIMVKEAALPITRLLNHRCDNDGSLQHQEIVDAVDNLPAAAMLIKHEKSLQPLLEAKDLMAVFKEMDKDDDGTISLEELLMWCSVEDDKLQAEMWYSIRVFVHLCSKKPSLPDNSLISVASSGAPGYTITGKSLLKNILLNPSKTRVELIKTLPKLQGLLRPSTYGNTVLAMLGSWHSGAMNFEAFNAFCHGRIVSQNLEDINREEIIIIMIKRKPRGQSSSRYTF